jgi:hypothetical protein
LGDDLGAWSGLADPVHGVGRAGYHYAASSEHSGYALVLTDIDNTLAFHDILAYMVVRSEFGGFSMLSLSKCDGRDA